MPTMQIFVSHSHRDASFCHDLVQALRGAGADVWYDEHNLGSGQLMEVVQRELHQRPVFIVILSPATFASRWVQRETRWAYELADREPTRIILPVTAQPIERDAFSGLTGWLFLHDFKRIEAPGYQPYPVPEAIRRTLHALTLTAPDEAPLSVAPRPGESVDTLIERGKALIAQKRFQEALPLFQLATQLAPRSSDAWGNLGYTLGKLKLWQESLEANDHALSLGLNEAWVWYNKGIALGGLQRYQEAIDTFDQALELDPTYVFAWNGKGAASRNLQRYQEAIAAYDQALKLDPTYARAWNNKGVALDSLKRWQEAITAYDQALELDPTYALAWSNKALVLRRLGRIKEAVAADQRAQTLHSS